MFGSGADTGSYDDFEQTDVILVWGSNTQEAHPIIYNHMRRGIKNGAKMVLIDPRKLPMVNFAYDWLPVNVGTDIALANAMGHVIIEENLYDKEFVDHATEFFDTYRAHVEKYTPEFAERITGIPQDKIRSIARLYATAPRAVIAWTLGITEHHNGTNNVHSLVNLGLLTGHVGKKGSALMPLRGQNNVQGGGDMGALPNKLPGFFNVEDDVARRRFEESWQCTIPSLNGLHLSSMLDSMREGQLKFLYIIGENPMQSDANTTAVRQALSNVDFLVVQDLFLTKTARMADIVLPAAGWGEVDGTYTNSERGVQRVRKAVDSPGTARDDVFIVMDIANRLGAKWTYTSAQDVWDELRSFSPAHYGMTYERLDHDYELSWPCPSIDEPPTKTLHTRLHSQEVGMKAKFVAVDFEMPIDETDEQYPLVLITGRRLAFYNTGVTTSNYGSKVKDQEEFLEMSEKDALHYGLDNGTVVKLSSRRGSVNVPVRMSTKMKEGNVFMAFHFPDTVDTNVLTNDAVDKKSGVASFKYTAVKIERL